MFNFLKNVFKPKRCIRPTGRSLEELLAIKSAEEWIHPPQREISEAEHELALARIAFEDTVWEQLFHMANYIKFKNGMLTDGFWKDRGEEKLLTDALESIKDFEEAMKIDNDKDWWHGFVWDGMKDNIRDMIKAPHGGDCTAWPCTCDRCFAEEKYKIPFTATFSKSEGNRLFEALRKQRDEAERREYQ